MEELLSSVSHYFFSLSLGPRHRKLLLSFAVQKSFVIQMNTTPMRDQNNIHAVKVWPEIRLKHCVYDVWSHGSIHRQASSSVFYLTCIEFK